MSPRDTVLIATYSWANKINPRLTPSLPILFHAIFIRMSKSNSNMADKAVAELRLSEVKLGQLPKWLSTCSFTPGGVVRAFGRGRTRYYNKYINVVRGNVAPVGQFIATFVILNYMWRYKVEKEHRLKKHHW